LRKQAVTFFSPPSSPGPKPHRVYMDKRVQRGYIYIIPVQALGASIGETSLNMYLLPSRSLNDKTNPAYMHRR
jgi:hypothetical protein